MSEDGKDYEHEKDGWARIKCGGFRGGWQRVFLVLQGGTLHFYRSDKVALCALQRDSRHSISGLTLQRCCMVWI